MTLLSMRICFSSEQTMRLREGFSWNYGKHMTLRLSVAASVGL